MTTSPSDDSSVKKVLLFRLKFYLMTPLEILLQILNNQVSRGYRQDNIY